MLEFLTRYNPQPTVIESTRRFFTGFASRATRRFRRQPDEPEVVDIIEGKRTRPAIARRRRNGSLTVTPKARALGETGGAPPSKRVSMNSPETLHNGMRGLTVFAPQSKWRKFALSDRFKLSDIAAMPIADVAELVADVSPEVSLALHVRTILSNSGYEIEARQTGSDEIDEAANEALKEMRRRIGDCYGSEDVLYSQAFTALWMRGGFLAEAVFAENLEDLADIAAPDPATLKFRRVRDDVRGDVWEFGQFQNGQFVRLSGYDQIRYAPLQPFPNRLEGRPLISSAFFISVFVMAVLRDYKRVIQQQGYPRHDIEMELEMLRDLMPEDARNNPEKFEEWAEYVVSKIATDYEALEPDEAFVHMKGINLNQPVGALSSAALQAFDGMFNALERMAARACKVPPLFMGIIENVSEANANRQFELFLLDLQAGQHLIENVFERLYEIALQAKGFLANVRFRFAKARESERLRDAQADLTEAKVAAFCYQMGWISQAEAAKRGAKVEAPDVDAPRESVAVNTSIGTPNGDAGVNRILDATRVPTVGQIQDAKEIFEGLMENGGAALITADAYDNQ